MKSDFSKPSIAALPLADDLPEFYLDFPQAVDLIEFGLREDIDWQAEGQRVLQMLTERSESLPPCAA